jgi:hypothetical protein
MSLNMENHASGVPKKWITGSTMALDSLHLWLRKLIIKNKNKIK